MAALLTGSPDAARDCVQETFSRLLHAAIRHRESSLRAYLSTITYRLAVRESLRMVKRGSVGDLDPPSGDPSPLDQVIVDEQQRGVCAVLRSLSTAHQEILVLRFYGEHSYEEIAGITGVPLGTVKSRIFHAVKSARIELNKRGIV
jgi:RNA polymerase sigma-70 factor (ECF subfamily)